MKLSIAVDGTRNNSAVEVPVRVVDSSIEFKVPNGGHGHQACTFMLDTADLRAALDHLDPPAKAEHKPTIMGRNADDGAPVADSGKHAAKAAASA